MLSPTDPSPAGLAPPNRPNFMHVLRFPRRRLEAASQHATERRLADRRPGRWLPLLVSMSRTGASPPSVAPLLLACAQAPSGPASRRHAPAGEPNPGAVEPAPD